MKTNKILEHEELNEKCKKEQIDVLLQQLYTRTNEHQKNFFQTNFKEFLKIKNDK